MKNNEKHTTLSEINVTPLVDVMLVLLVVFMITAPMMSQRVDINIPETKEVLSVPSSENPLIINIKKNGSIAIGDVQVALDSLAQKIKAIMDVKVDKQVYIKADRKTEYGVVAGVIAELKSSGISMISLVTLPRQ